MSVAPPGGALVWVVDDDPLILELIRLWLQRASIRALDFASGMALLEHLDLIGLPDQPTCLVTDYRMPEIDGILLAHLLRERGFEGGCALMSAKIDVEHAVSAMRGGFFHVLEKPLAESAFISEIGDALLRCGDQFEARARQRELPRRVGTLTGREREVMIAVVSGRLNKQIADDLNVSIKTIETHRGHVMAKLGLRCTADLVRFAFELESAGLASVAEASSQSRESHGT